MSLRTFIDKNGNTWEWIETPEVTSALKSLHAGDYSGPLYAPHPHIKNETETDEKSTDVG